jgi:hypothetical protein
VPPQTLRRHPPKDVALVGLGLAAGCCWMMRGRRVVALVGLGLAAGCWLMLGRRVVGHSALVAERAASPPPRSPEQARRWGEGAMDFAQGAPAHRVCGPTQVAVGEWVALLTAGCCEQTSPVVEVLDGAAPLQAHEQILLSNWSALNWARR